MTTTQIQSQIDSITKQLIQKYHPDKIILFGSGAVKMGDPFIKSVLSEGKVLYG